LCSNVDVAVNRDSAALIISNLSNARHLMQVRKTQGTPLALQYTISNSKILRNNASMQVHGAITYRLPITTCLNLQAAEADWHRRLKHIDLQIAGKIGIERRHGLLRVASRVS
jgi:hypothetical protein